MEEDSNSTSRKDSSETEELSQSIQDEVADQEQRAEESSQALSSDEPVDYSSSTLVEMPAFPDDEVVAHVDEADGDGAPSDGALETTLVQPLAGLQELQASFQKPEAKEPESPTLDEHTGEFNESSRTSVTPISKRMTQLTMPAVVAAQEDDVPEASREEAEPEVEEPPPEDRTLVVHRPIPEPKVEGKNIEGYEILGELGRGGAGIVYRAFCARMRALVALKIMRSSVGTTQDERFEREIRFLHRLDHPNLVSIYDSGKTDRGERYLVMKYVDGTVLEKLYEISPPPGPWLANILSDVAEGLAAAHSQGIIHRDVKPENIILSSSGIPILVDFGVAVEEGNDQARLTSAGRTVGTPCYMAPEQILGLSEQIGSQTDMYSLGVVLYEGISGRLPFRGDTNLETLRQIVHDSVPPLTDRTGNPVSDELNGLVSRCLEKKPSHRFKSMEVLVAKLREYAEGDRTVKEPMGEPTRSLESLEQEEESESMEPMDISSMKPFTPQFLGISLALWCAFGLVNGLYQWWTGGGVLGWVLLSLLVVGVLKAKEFQDRAGANDRHKSEK